MTLAAVFERVVNALESARAQYVVVGSTAAAAWGVVRSTRDVDLAMAVAGDEAQAIVGELEGDDLYFPAHDATAALAHGGSFNVLHPATGGKVDVFVWSPGDAFERSRLDRRVRSEILGVAAWVATPEDIVLSKLRWRRTSGSEVQWRDCVEIAASQTLDRQYLNEWAVPLGVADDLADLLAAVDAARAEDS